MSQSGKTEYELERDRRVAENKRKMEELGVVDAAAALAATTKAVKRQKRAKSVIPAESIERRVSSRDKKAVNYCELETKTAREPKAPVDYTQRLQGITLDQDTAEQLRLEMADKRGGSKSGGKPRGPIDSGKGVRIQGGRVYDSKHGVTCHWCRQKTLEDHVTCTNPCCGNGRRMPLSFCAKCLKNRHGEDYTAAEASDSWWCPACRGSCGPGCVTCCNCGPCRKKAGLEPTHQVVKLARDAGFDNVHDYLVHLVTDETAEVIAERKLQFPWGAWLKGGEDGSEASEQTGACKGGCSSGHHTHARGADKAGQEGSSGGAEEEEEEDKQTTKDQGRPAAAAGGGSSVKDFFRAAKPPTGRKTTKKAANGKAAAAAAAAAVEPEAKPEQQQEEVDDGPMLSTQDMRLSRKQRIMQRLGLAPVTVVTN